MEGAIGVQHGPPLVVGTELVEHMRDVDFRPGARCPLDGLARRLPVLVDDGAARGVLRGEAEFFVLDLSSAVAFRYTPLPAPFA